jgi:signal transduction histidine kinase
VSEAVQKWAGPWERYQLDELPGIALAAAVALAWFVWRRIREVRNELARRVAAEMALESALEENRRLSLSKLRLQEDERRRLARELHDELGQHLNAIKIETVAIRGAAGDGEEVRRGAEAIASSADHLHAVVRDMTRSLRPAGLDELGLAAALEHHVEGWREKSGVDASLQVEGDIDVLPEDVNITLYRCVQEALTNVSRHAGAHRVHIRVARNGAGAVELSLSDDGSGARTPWTSEGVGLIGMRERVEALGGSMEVSTEPRRGFTVSARLPIARVAA